MSRAVLALVLAGCCPTWRDRLVVADVALLSCDAAQTIRFSDFGLWDLGEHGTPIREANPVLGENPSPTTLIAWLGVSIASVVVARVLDRKLGDVALVGVAVAETVVIASNVRYGGVCGFGPTQLVKVRGE